MSKSKKRLSKFINFNKNLANEILQHLAGCGMMLVSNFLTTPYKGASYADLFSLTQNLEKNHLMKRTKKNNQEFFILTEKGRSMAALLEFKATPSHKWDGKWRVIIFDVPERYKRRRDFLREKLQALGFEQLQESVFVFPYPIPKALDWLIEEIGLKINVRYLVVESMNYEKDLLRKFRLMR